MLNENEIDFPMPSELREVIINHLDVPVVFKNQIKSTIIPLLASNLTEKYGDIMLDFRVVPKSYKDISWEAQHTFEKATILDFISWQNEKNAALNPSNPFKKYKKSEYWAYSSYNYMNVVFPNDSDIQSMKWDMFGFPEITGKESAFWLGSEDANTPCHFDSYGCNLIAQVEGRKQWILFPPSDTSFLYPTRIPYEESSVFSSVNVLKADFTCHPLFKESDSHSRLEEGVTRALMSSLISCYEPEKENWLNPKEELVSPDETIKYITTSLQEIKEMDQDEKCLLPKVCKTSSKTDVHSQIRKDSFVCNICNYKYIEKVESSSFQEYLTKTNQQLLSNTLSTKEITLDKIINSFVHPEVVSLICNLLKKE